MMLEATWNQYRGWAKRARAWQAAGSNWNMWVFGCTVAAAVLAAAASQIPSSLIIGRVVAFASAAAVALTPILGNQLLQLKLESKWIRARAAAEAIKSQCFRYAARAGDYAGADSDAVLKARCDAASAPLLSDGLVPIDDPHEKDVRRPPYPMGVEWYRQNRLRDQHTYYADGQRNAERAATRLRWVLLAASVVGVLLGALGGVIQPAPFSPWIAVLTTFGATVLAYGFMQRHEFRAGSYGAMAYRLTALDAGGPANVADLVTATEDLLEAEHGSWLVFFTKTIAAPKTQ